MTPEEIKAGRERLAKFMGWTVVYFTDELGEWEDMPSHYIDNEKNVKCEYNTWHPDQNDSQMRMIREKMNEEERNLFMNELVRLLESIEWFEMVNAPPSMQFEAAIKAIGEQK